MSKSCNTTKPGSSLSAAQMIKQAMAELLCQKKFTDITVTDVVSQAGVARVSFYRNFTSTSQLLDLLAEDLVHEFAKKILPIISSSDARKWRDFLFQYIYEVRSNQDLFSRLRPENITTVFNRIAENIRNVEKELQFSSVWETYRLSALTGMINNVIRRWIDYGMQETPEEIVDILMDHMPI